MTTNYSAGHNAEKCAAAYLSAKGFEIVELNWKTRRCEIDIVARRSGRIYFVEVKSRRGTSQGFGLEYITPRKLKQMSFAAEAWVQAHDWRGEYQLSAISVDAAEITFVEDI